MGSGAGSCIMYCPSPKIQQKRLLLLCGRPHTVLHRPPHRGQDRGVVLRSRQHRRSRLQKMVRGDHHQSYCHGERVDVENQQENDYSCMYHRRAQKDTLWRHWRKHSQKKGVAAHISCPRSTSPRDLSSIDHIFHKGNDKQ